MVTHERGFLWLAVLLAATLQAAFGQAQAVRPAHGVVWQEPAESARAVSDVFRMSTMGIEAVRTAPVRHRDVLQLADTLQIRIYQDLPIRRLPAARLLDTLAYAERILAPLLRNARMHASARTFGLARSSDTSDSTACAYLDALAAYARRSGGAGVRVYYITQFIERDVCGHTVDFVLLEARGSRDPARLLDRWRAAHPDVPAGIASIGKWVDPDATFGLNVEGSAESQARFLEQALGRVLDHDAAAEAVFVYRWRDIEPEFPSPAYDLEHPYRHTFGLFTQEGVGRPAADVVAGVYGRGQRVFAFPSGRRTRPGDPVTTMAGWVVVLILSIAYASSPRLRPMVPRYFLAHGFYREAVREGRDVLVTASTVLLVALSIAVALIWIVVLDAWRTHSAFLLVWRLLPTAVEEFIITLLAKPVLALILIAGVYAIALTIWSALLAFSSRRRYPVSSAQALMLAIWPRWPVILLMIAAMVLATLPRETAFVPSLYLIGAWILVMLTSTARTLYDYYSVTKVSPMRLVVGVLLNPIILLLLAAVGLALRYWPETQFVWHAVTRT